MEVEEIVEEDRKREERLKVERMAEAILMVDEIFEAAMKSIERARMSRRFRRITHHAHAQTKFRKGTLDVQRVKNNELKVHDLSYR
jgi:hypothetical protein